jgi:exopolysaccharide biosynthesis polyprenyl glycosylphosphotransferase
MSIISAAGMRMRTSTIKNPRNTLVLGSAALASKVYQEMLRSEGPEHVRLVKSKDLHRVTARDTVSRIVIVDSEFDGNSELTDALIDYKFRGVKIETVLDSYEKTSRKIWLEGLSPEWLILADGFNPSGAYLKAKRVLDIVFALLLFLVFAPLMAIVSALIKLDSPGPVIFSQERVGLNGKRFLVHKFRSMRQDAEETSGPTWAKEQDDRCTRVGAFIRRCRVDELPQLINVLRGDMSFVGPRPERPYFVDLLKGNIRYYDLRHYVKPGITGWAQVMYPYGASVEDAYQKLQYDLYYAKHVSLSIDILILLKTIKVVLTGAGR